MTTSATTSIASLHAVGTRVLVTTAMDVHDMRDFQAPCVQLHCRLACVLHAFLDHHDSTTVPTDAITWANTFVVLLHDFHAFVRQYAAKVWFPWSSKKRTFMKKVDALNARLDVAEHALRRLVAQAMTRQSAVSRSTDSPGPARETSRRVQYLFDTDTLVDQLSHGNDREKEHAAVILEMVAKNESEIRSTIVRLGGILPLVAALRVGTEILTPAAAGILLHLGEEDTANTIAAVKLGVIPHLMQHVRDGPTPLKLKAAGVLSQIAQLPLFRASVVAAGAIRPLVACLVVSASHEKQTRWEAGREFDRSVVDKRELIERHADDEDIASEYAMEALYRLACGDMAMRRAVCRSACMYPLTTLLLMGTPSQQANAKALLLEFAHTPEPETMMAGSLLPILHEGSPIQQEGACLALHILLTSVDKATCPVLGHLLAAVGPLIRFLSDGAPERKALAAQVIADMTRNDGRARNAFGDAGAIPILLDLLRSGMNEHNDSARSAVLNLMIGNRYNQGRVVACGGRSYFDMLSST